MNELLKYLNESKSPTAKTIYKEIQSLRTGLKQLKNRGTPIPNLSRMKEEALVAINNDLALLNAGRREKIKTVLDDMGKGWNSEYEKNRVKHERELYDYQLKIGAMSKAELEKESINMMVMGLTEDPRKHDILSIALKTEDESQYKIYRDEITKAGYDRPWEHSQAGKSLVQEYQILKTNKLGIQLVDKNSKPFALDVPEIMLMLDQAEQDEQEDESDI